MTIQEYVSKNNISYRELARRLNISVVYLCDLVKERRKTISEKLANKFKEVAPEIEIMEETRKIYKIGGTKQWMIKKQYRY